MSVSVGVRHALPRVTDAADHHSLSADSLTQKTQSMSLSLVPSLYTWRRNFPRRISSPKTRSIDAENRARDSVYAVFIFLLAWLDVTEREHTHTHTIFIPHTFAG